MLKILPRCDLQVIKPQTVLAILVASSIYEHHNQDCEIYSVVDGVHGPNSKHPEGFAFDIRIKHLDGNDKDISAEDMRIARMIAAELREALGPQYDVVVESNHIHVEYDPK